MGLKAVDPAWVVAQTLFSRIWAGWRRLQAREAATRLARGCQNGESLSQASPAPNMPAQRTVLVDTLNLLLKPEPFKD
jgi:hypothetical protein